MSSPAMPGERRPDLPQAEAGPARRSRPRSRARRRAGNGGPARRERLRAGAGVARRASRAPGRGRSATLDPGRGRRSGARPPAGTGAARRGAIEHDPHAAKPLHEVASGQRPVGSRAPAGSREAPAPGSRGRSPSWASRLLELSANARSNRGASHAASSVAIRCIVLRITQVRSNERSSVRARSTSAARRLAAPGPEREAAGGEILRLSAADRAGPRRPDARRWPAGAGAGQRPAAGQPGRVDARACRTPSRTAGAQDSSSWQ